MTYTNAMINNTSAASRAKTICKKKDIINAIYNKIGVKLSSSLSIKALKGILDE